MKGKKGDGSFGPQQLVNLVLAIIIALFIFAVAASIWAVLFSADTKNDATAKNVMHEVASLINAHKNEAQWSAQTLIRFPREHYALVGFSPDFIGFPPDSSALFKRQEKGSTQLCVFDYRDIENPKLMDCENLKGIEQIGGIYLYKTIIPDEYLFYYSPENEKEFVERQKNTCFHTLEKEEPGILKINRQMC